MSRRTHLLAGIAGCLVFTLGCTGSDSSGADLAEPATEAPGEASPPPDAQPVLMKVVPSEPAAGGSAELLFPESTPRGGYFVLERWEEDQWVLSHYLVSDGGDREALIYAPGEYEGGDDYGVGGPGPDGVLLPDEMSPGFWRVCTENARPQMCAQFML